VKSEAELFHIHLWPYKNSLEVPAGLHAAHVVFEGAVELEALSSALDPHWTCRERCDTHTHTHTHMAEITSLATILHEHERLKHHHVIHLPHCLLSCCTIRSNSEENKNKRSY